MCPKFSVGNLWKRGIRRVHQMLFLPHQSVPLKSTLNPTADRDLFKSQAAKIHGKVRVANQTRFKRAPFLWCCSNMQERIAQFVHGSFHRLYFNLKREYCTRFCIRLCHKSQKATKHGYYCW